MSKLKSLTNEFLVYKSNEKARILENYYRKKAAYFQAESRENISELEKIYEEIIDNEEYEFIRLDIDLLLLEYYYRDKNFKRTSEILENSTDYIFDPKYSIEREALIYGMSPKIDHIDKEDRVNKIQHILKNIESKPWSIYHSKIYSGIAGAYYYLRDKEKTIETLELLIQENKKNGLISEAIPIMNSLAYILNNEKSFDLNLEAIDLANISGHTRIKYTLHRNLGHFYFNKKRFQKAYEEYKNATIDKSSLVDFRTNAIDYTYMGLALFNLDKELNFKKADSIYDFSYNLAYPDDLPTKRGILQRKLWAYQYKGLTDKILETKYKLADINYRISNNNEVLEDFHVNSIMKIRARDSEINLLTLENELRDNKINKQRLFLIISMILLLLLGRLIYYYKQKNSILKKLDEKNSIIKTQNEELVNLVSKLELSNQNLENFAYVAAHDIKHPITVIITLANILKDKFQSKFSKKDSEYFNNIITKGENLNEIVSDLLKFSSITKNLQEPGRLNLNDLASTLINDLLVTNKDPISISIVNKLPDVYAHKTLVTQLFLNIINNSIKFNENENVNIEIGSKKYDNNFTQIFIKDNGIGIEPKNQKVIFELFKKINGQNDYQGNGLGLSTCKKIIDYYNGEIWVESEQYVGTIINFTLPMT